MADTPDAPLDDPDPSKGEREPARTNWLVRLLPLAVLVGALGTAYAFGLQEWISFERLRENRDAITTWVAENTLLASLGYVIGYAVLVAISFPGGSFLTVLGGFLFGVWPGTLFVVAAATAGATLLFLAARTGLAAPLKDRAGGLIRRMEAGFSENAFSYMMVLRLVPLFPFWAVNLAPAFLGVSLPTYVLATFIGIIPGSLVYTSVGNGLGAVFDAGGDPDLGLIFQPSILLPILGLALLSLIPVLHRRLRRRPAAED
ncbi:MAG: TVP38/TMEM64 family protein [Alphaproteobacteria bacterium]